MPRNKESSETESDEESSDNEQAELKQLKSNIFGAAKENLPVDLEPSENSGVSCPEIKEELLRGMVQGEYGDVPVYMVSQKQDALSAVWRPETAMVITNTRADVTDWNSYTM